MRTERRVVGHHDDGHPLLPVQLVEQLHDLVAGLFIEVAGRFVGQDESRIVRQRPRDRDALAFAARKLRRPVAEPVTEPDPLGKLERPLAPDPPRHPAVDHRNLDVLLHRKVREQIEALKDEADLPVPDRCLLHIRKLADLDILEEVLSAGRHVEHAENIQQRRLAGAGGPDEADEFSAFDRRIDPFQDGNLQIPGKIGLADIDQPDNVLRPGRSRRIIRHYFESCVFWYGRYR